MKALFLPFMLGALATPVGAAQPLQVIGYSGYLGEWELTATVTETAPGATAEYSGPLTMKHVGICTQDGPEEKTGALRVQMSASSSRLNATLSVSGVEGWLFGDRRSLQPDGRAHHRRHGGGRALARRGGGAAGIAGAESFGR